jgi:hypothetical protein
MSLLAFLRDPRRVIADVLPVILLAVAGCYTMDERDGVKTYAFAGWVPACVALVGLAIIGAGVLALRRSRRGMGILLIVVGVFFGVLVTGLILYNRVSVDDRHLVVRDFYLSPEYHDVVFDEILSARLDSQRIRTRSGETMKYTLELTMKGGGPFQSIVVKNALREAWPEVAKQLRARGFNNLPEQLPE